MGFKKCYFFCFLLDEIVIFIHQKNRLDSTARDSRGILEFSQNFLILRKLQVATHVQTHWKKKEGVSEEILLKLFLNFFWHPNSFCSCAGFAMTTAKLLRDTFLIGAACYMGYFAQTHDVNPVTVYKSMSVPAQFAEARQNLTSESFWFSLALVVGYLLLQVVLSAVVPGYMHKGLQAQLFFYC